MGARARASRGLAARIVRVTLLIGSITLITAAVVAVVNTSRLASGSMNADSQASMQLVEDTLLARVAAAGVTMSQVAQSAVADDRPGALQSSLRSAMSSETGVVSTIAVLDERAAPIAAVPSTASATSPAATVVADAALAGVSGAIHHDASSGTGSLWLVQTVLARDGHSRIILVELDTTFLGDLVRSGSNRIRTLYLLQGSRVLAAGSDAPIDFAQARIVQSDTGAGRLVASDEAGRVYSGLYDEIEGITGVEWQVVAISPRFAASAGAATTLWPTMLVLALGGCASLAFAWYAARRVVAPLRALESAALTAATGAYVEPIEALGDDETGRVAKAFNAVALRLNALHDLSKLLASSSQLDQVLDGILTAMGHMLGPGSSVVYLLDEGGRWLVPVRARGADIALAPAIDSSSDMWLAASLNDAGPSLFVSRGRRLSDEVPGIVRHESAAIVAPLVAGRITMGVVVILSESDFEVTDAELEMVRTFSAQAAIAVHNSRLFAFESESRRVAEGLRTVAEQLVRPGGFVDALTDVELSVAELFGAVRAVFAIVDRPALGIPYAADRDLEGEVLGFSLRLLARADGQSPIVVRIGDDGAADAEMERLSAHELIVVPIALESEHGAVLVIALGEKRANRRDLELADTVANEIALAFDNAYFYEQALTRANSLETVFHISQAVGSSLQVKVVLNRVLDVVQKILTADAVALQTYDSRTRLITTEMARGRVSASVMDRAFAAGDDIVGYVFESGEPVALRDLHSGMEGVAGDAVANGLHSLVAVPLLARGRSIGVLTVYSTEPDAFTDDDVSLLQTFAAQAALAIDTARMYSREHEVASVLQRSIVPGALPEFPGIESASLYEPAGGDAEIGGDYYDLFPAPDESIWLAIADVCGKGVGAATKTSMIKYAVRSFVAAGLPAASVMTQVNKMVSEGGGPADIVTLWLGRVDLGSHTLTWASGGHPPGMIRRDDGSIVLLGATGPLLGAVAEVTYTEDLVEFGVGDSVLLYTDGVTEARTGNTFFGEQRVREALADGGSPGDIVDRLQAAVRHFAQNRLRDDVAVLAIRVLGIDDELESQR
ncbi:MAG: SpoIIE family protein phosphatase [Coriobacteriia bacterium]|nr:SpoIIE family protein phosphatase [Coriobacteriia bacterium]